VTPDELAQRRQAAARGHRTRTERRDLRVALKAREAQLADALEHPGAAGVTVERLLLWLPGVGPTLMPQLLAQAQVARTRTVGTLTPRERDALLGLRHWEAVSARG
jgi:hypothetical protein